VIPSIDDILAMLLAGDMDLAKAKHWLAEHTRLAVEQVTGDRRDDMAHDAMVAMIRFGDTEKRDPKYIGTTAYAIADGMLEARDA
jgi:hypothetical protein